jgi:hypothetical protein
MKSRLDELRPFVFPVGFGGSDRSLVWCSSAVTFALM